MERKKCTRCFVNLPLNHFSKKRDDTYYLHCDQCRKVRKAYVASLNIKDQVVYTQVIDNPAIYFSCGL